MAVYLWLARPITWDRFMEAWVRGYIGGGR